MATGKIEKQSEFIVSVVQCSAGTQQQTDTVAAPTFKCNYKKMYNSQKIQNFVESRKLYIYFTDVL